MKHLNTLSKGLSDFHAITAAVWAAYQDVGPGRVDAELFSDGEELSAEIASLLVNEEVIAELPADIDAEHLRAAVLKVADLANRCATHSEGLCFITGEAGLVPRRDWYAAMDEGLVVIERAVAVLEGK